jgi:hypothetical protein
MPYFDSGDIEIEKPDTINRPIVHKKETAFLYIPTAKLRFSGPGNDTLI